MAYSEIINEIQEQIDELTARRDANLATKEAIDLELSQFAQQLEDLMQLKANAQSLVDNQQSLDINLNVNVTGAGEGSNVIRHTGSTAV
jgi:hypothetical protein